MSLKFKCSKCGKERLEEVMNNVIQYSAIQGIEETEDGLCLDYGENNCEDGDVLCYQCIDCNAVLKHESGYTITDEEDLKEWLKKNCLQE